VAPRRFGAFKTYVNDLNTWSWGLKLLNDVGGASCAFSEGDPRRPPCRSTRHGGRGERDREYGHDLPGFFGLIRLNFIA
jgi:hypothetical protein